MSVVDIVGIKTAIKSTLDINNTITSSVLDLSDSLSTRVQQVAIINPEKLPLQPSIFPCVTIHTERKNIEISDIATSQLTNKRRADIDFKILGITFNTDFQTDVFNDPADQDCEYLMENIELILRSNTTLDSTIKWQIPTDVSYHSTNIDEDAHMRVGELTLRATLYY